MELNPLYLEEEENQYTNSTYLIVSKVAYLIKKKKKIFENEFEPPKIEIYNELENNKNARIIRNLCMIRTGLEKYFTKIQRAMTFDMKNLGTLPEYIPPHCITQLHEDGIPLMKANYRAEKYVFDINRYIADRINLCRELFPIWIDWEYLRELFIMPHGLTETGAKRANREFHENMARYPYQVYLNWHGGACGNILYNDKKFVSLLYEAHEDFFQDMSKVTDASDATKSNIYDFIGNNEKTAFVVDCENSDPYKLHAVLRNLDSEELAKVSKIILYDDPHTTVAWKILNEFTNIPVEHILVERVKQNKSLVDMSLAVGACKEFYQGRADSFVIVSSDSDYWGLISTLPEAHFLVMVEESKCGHDMKNAMENAGIFYCYIDDFCTGNSEEVKLHTLRNEIRQRLNEAFQVNVEELLQQVYRETMVDMTAGEKKQFYNTYIKPMRIVIDAQGNASIRLGGD